MSYCRSRSLKSGREIEHYLLTYRNYRKKYVMLKESTTEGGLFVNNKVIFLETCFFFVFMMEMLMQETGLEVVIVSC